MGRWALGEYLYRPGPELNPAERVFEEVRLHLDREVHLPGNCSAQSAMNTNHA